MKRSTINAVIDEVKARVDEFKITLPFFAYWTPADFAANKDKIGRIAERMMGWDVTDFGRDDFDRCGTFHRQKRRQE